VDSVCIRKESGNVVHSLREWIPSASGKNPLAERVDHVKNE